MERQKLGEGDTRTTDVVVVGSGGAGLATAIVSASEGLGVVVLEKSELIGGTTAMSGGGIWAPANSFMRAAGDDDSQDVALEYLRQLMGQFRDTTVLEAFLENAPIALDYFQRHSDLTFATRSRSPDYYSNFVGATKTSRAVDSGEFDARELGPDSQRIRASRPESLLFGGLAVTGGDVAHLLKCFKSLKSFQYVARLLASYAAQRVRFGRSTRLVLGRALVARMMNTLRSRGVEVLTSTAAHELIMDGSGVVGVIAETAGKFTRILARRGVVLATGGFSQNGAMRKNWIPFPDNHFSVGSDSSHGDGIRLGLAAGSSMPSDKRESAYWVPVSVRHLLDGTTATFPHLVTDRAKPGVIAVNGRGRRFVNEADSYHDFVRAMYESETHQPTIPAYLVCDSRTLRRYGLGLARPWPFSKVSLIRDGYLITGSTVGDLASNLGIESGSLRATVSEFNKNAKRGEDPDFGRGSSAYNRHMGDANHRPNPCLAPLEIAPFYAVRVFPGNLSTSRGLSTDQYARVLDRRGPPIEGLYAVGNDADSVFAGAYPGPGASLGPALTFAYVAGMHMASKVDGGKKP
jgi:succinate dehydrogenase/fumarate reductase flavoprotein subunit